MLVETTCAYHDQQHDTQPRDRRQQRDSGWMMAVRFGQDVGSRQIDERTGKCSQVDVNVRLTQLHQAADYGAADAGCGIQREQLHRPPAQLAGSVDQCDGVQPV